MMAPLSPPRPPLLPQPSALGASPQNYSYSCHSGQKPWPAKPGQVWPHLPLQQLLGHIPPRPPQHSSPTSFLSECPPLLLLSAQRLFPGQVTAAWSPTGQGPPWHLAVEVCSECLVPRPLGAVAAEVLAQHCPQPLVLPSTQGTHEFFSGWRVCVHSWFGFCNRTLFK